MGTEPGPGASGGAAEDQYIVSLQDLFRIIRRRLWVVSLVATVLTGAVVGLSMAQTPVYEASTKILVGQERGVTTDPNYALGLQQLTQTMVGAVSSRPVAKAVIRQENLRMTTEEFLEHLSVEQVPEASPNANAIAITATVWERAVVPDAPVSPNPVRNGLLALALGLIIGGGLAFLLEYLDDSWDSPEEMEQVSGAPTFGIIPEVKASKSQKGVSVAQSALKGGP